MVANSSRRRRRQFLLVHALLLLALLPQPLRFGHWDLPAIDIPGAGLSIGLPGGGDGHDHAHDAGEDHASHCHEGVAACGNFTAAAGLTIPILAAAVLLGLAAIALRRVPGSGETIPASRDLAPVPPPPRSAVLAS